MWACALPVGLSKFLVGHGDLIHYEPILVESTRKLRAKAFAKIFAKIKNQRQFQSDDLSEVFTNFLGKLYCPKYFLIVTPMYYQMGNIKILEVIWWGMVKKRLRNTVLDYI